MKRKLILLGVPLVLLIAFIIPVKPRVALSVRIMSMTNTEDGQWKVTFLVSNQCHRTCSFSAGEFGFKYAAKEQPSMEWAGIGGRSVIYLLKPQEADFLDAVIPSNAVFGHFKYGGVARSVRGAMVVRTMMALPAIADVIGPVAVIWGRFSGENGFCNATSKTIPLPLAVGASVSVDSDDGP